MVENLQDIFIPPEVKINNVSINGTGAFIDGTIEDKFPENDKLIKDDGAVSSLEKDTVPTSTSIENISIRKNSDYVYNATFSSEILKDFKDNTDGLKQVAKYTVLTGVYEKVSDKVNNIDECEYKRNNLYLLEQLISQQKILSDELEEKIMGESNKAEPNYSIITIWRANQDKLQVKIDLLISKHEKLYKSSSQKCKIKVGS